MSSCMSALPSFGPDCADAIRRPPVSLRQRDRLSSGWLVSGLESKGPSERGPDCSDAFQISGQSFGCWVHRVGWTVHDVLGRHVLADAPSCKAHDVARIIIVLVRSFDDAALPVGSDLTSVNESAYHASSVGRVIVWMRNGLPSMDPGSAAVANLPVGLRLLGLARIGFVNANEWMVLDGWLPRFQGHRWRMRDDGVSQRRARSAIEPLEPRLLRKMTAVSSPGLRPAPRSGSKLPETPKGATARPLRWVACFMRRLVTLVPLRWTQDDKNEHVICYI